MTFSDTGLQIVSFGQDTGGELYLLNYGGGTIHQIIDAP
jgi:hypothetical protein